MAGMDGTAGRSGIEVGRMKEIMMPVLLMDEDCRTCEFMELESSIRNQMWAEEMCIAQEVEVRCRDVHKCERLRRKYNRTKENGTSAIRR